jgi:hypothetical protein
MKESIQYIGDEVAIVIYDAPLPPKYFRLSKKFLRILFVAVPVVFSIVFLGLFYWGLVSRLQEIPRPTFPTEMSEQEIKLAALEVEVSELKQSNHLMTNKLASQPSAALNEDPFLMIIKKPYGMQNLLSKNMISADQFEIVKDQAKVSLKFQIISTNAESRVTGHILVFMISSAGTLVYPNETNQFLTTGIKYTQGEPFAVARLRPTTATFQHQRTEDNLKFIVYIFNREGDLLLLNETQNFPIGIKK